MRASVIGCKDANWARIPPGVPPAGVRLRARTRLAKRPNRWLALECNRDDLIGSAFRFMTDWPHDDVGHFVAAVQNGAREQLVMPSAQRALF